MVLIGARGAGRVVAATLVISQDGTVIAAVARDVSAADIAARYRFRRVGAASLARSVATPCVVGVAQGA